MSYQEFKNNEIEHERSNDNQGKRPDQYHSGAKIFFLANVILLAALLIYKFLN
jgi:hypothetical protein